MEQKQQHQPHGGNGFLLGVIVGAAVTLLFTTKKGRELFKMATEEGVATVKRKIDETKEQLSELEDVEEAADYLEPEDRPESPQEIRHLAEKSGAEAAEEIKKETKSPRKFFKRG